MQRQVLDSALAQFPVIGNQIATNIHSFHGSSLALAVGILGSIYGGLGIAQATQHALNKVWGGTAKHPPNPVRARLRSLLLVVADGAAVLATTALSALSAAANAYGASLGGLLRAIVTGLAVALNVALFMVAFRVLTARSVAIRQILGGAITAAIIWPALQWTGAFLIGDKLKGATATCGLFGLVPGMLLWIYLGALTVVICAEVNVVRAERLWPRALLTPFTDNVQLTSGNRRAYTSYPKTERHKGFQKVDVDFDQPRSPSRKPPNPDRCGERWAAGRVAEARQGHTEGDGLLPRPPSAPPGQQSLQRTRAGPAQRA